MCLAVPGKIRAVTGEGLERTGEVDFAGAVQRVNLAFVPEAGVDDYVLVHAGVAIARLSTEEAEATLECLRAIGELSEGKP
ncbi:MAG: HypC/HybG/HupF family hydrogenase formation chaperone [Fimbriimonadales bacterium]|nr:HypC/HybG/HupF family hydrogenase formation chaperone [Fimbriimonadales bacterium]